MGRTLSSTESYLRRLAEGLDALGPAETEDVIAEIRAHLAEALADANGDADVALARFGTADALAARILEERGILSTGLSVAEAPGAARHLALTADIALWLVGYLLFYSLVVGQSYFYGSPGPLFIGLTWLSVALAAAASAWWWIKKRREPGYVTTGMQLLGLRRIRVGQTTRVIRTRDIPGLSRGGRVFPALRMVLVAALLASFIYSVVSAQSGRADVAVQGATMNSTTGVYVVSDVYRQVVVGTGTGPLSSAYAPSAQAVLEGLVQRRRSGKVATYSIASVELPNYSGRTGLSQSTDEVVALVTVYEYADASDSPVAYQYRVSAVFTAQGDGISRGQWLIRSAERVEQ